LDLKERVIRFKNTTTSKKGEISIMEKALIGNELYICSCLGSVGDEIEIVGNLIVDGVEARWKERKN